MAVTVIAPDCITADSYTKPICVLGPVEGFALIESTPGAAAFVERVKRDTSGKSDRNSSELEQFQSRRFQQFVAPAGLPQKTDY
jgi:thiamine biosynthesis lipoprotein ApbE